MDKQLPGAGGTAVLVLGPPRSGTSAVSHVLSELGVEFGRPERFVDPDRNTHNPIFFELQALNDLNNRVLAAAGLQYELFDCLEDPRGLTVPGAEAFVADVRRLIAEELGGAPLIGMKDPRFVLTLPFWMHALAECGYSVRCVLTTRDVEATVRSNEAVNRFSPGHNRRLVVLSEQLSALQLETEAAFLIDYDALVEAPLEQASKLAAWLGVERDAAAAAQVVSRRLRHQAAIATEREPLLFSDFCRTRIDAFVEWRDELERFGLVELIRARRVDAARVRAELAAANEQKWMEGVAAHAEIARLTALLADADRQLLAALTAKAEEGTRFAVEAAELRDQLHRAEQAALEANTVKAQEGERWAAEVAELRGRLHLAEQEALAANTVKAQEGAQWAVELATLRERLHDAEQDALAAKTQKAEEGTRFIAEIGALRAELAQVQEAAGRDQLQMQLRIQGLERRQRLAVSSGLLLAFSLTAVALLLEMAW